MKRNRTKSKVRTREVFQTEACECGAAALSVILNYYGCSMPLEQIRYECGINRDGCTARDIVLAGRHFGLEGHCYKVPLEKLKKAPKPAIIHWDFQHFVVLDRVTGKGAVINDPAKGRRKVSMEELDRYYTGIYITFSPSDGFKKQEGENVSRFFLKKRLLSDKSSVRYLVAAGILLIIPGLLIPVFSNLFVDRIFSSNPAYILTLVMCMGLVYLYQVIMELVRSKVLDRLKFKMSAVSADSLLYRMFRLPILFYDQRYSGELATRLETDNQANTFLAGEYIEALLNIIVAAACLVFMFIYNVPLTFLGLAGVGVSIVITGIMTHRIAALNMKKQQDRSRISGVLCAGISASESIKACGVENEYSSEMLGWYANYTDTEQTLSRAQKIIDAVTPAIGTLFSMAVLILGARFVIGGSLTIGMLSAFTMLLSSFIAPVNCLLSFRLSAHAMKASYARVTDIENAACDVRFDSAMKSGLDTCVAGRITVRDLSFGYNPNKPPVIDGISFTAHVGTRIGIVGVSGCGKSTLGKLLAGLLAPWSGSIMLGDVPINEIPDEWLCGSLSYVGQKGDFFYGTIYDNVTMWKTGYSTDDFYNAMVDSDLDSFASSLTGGVDYKIIENGRNLSGGQRQRIQIARGLISNPTVLILDEATSALDTVTEQKVMKAIERRGCTCVIVAHRLSTIRDCDIILVLDSGKIAEAGTHEQLMGRNGLYAALVTEC